MSLTKITNADLTGKGVIGQPDVPSLPAAEMQAKIEEIVRDVVIPNINDNIDELDNNFLKKTGDGANETVAFSEAGSRANIATGETLATLFGKIKKYFTDLKTIAFTGNFADLTSNAHKSQHATGGADALTPADIGAQAALTLPLSISNGGTGAATAAAALAALGGASYETGTWTPTFTYSTVQTAPTITATQMSGQYVKVGKIVFLQFYASKISVTNAGAGYGAGIGGIPFTPDSKNILSGMVAGFTGIVNNLSSMPSVGDAADVVLVATNNSNGTWKVGSYNYGNTVTAIYLTN